jgi:Leucine-rich repeat (LRR) protein
VGELTQLRMLDIGHNRLASLPGEVGALVELRLQRNAIAAAGRDPGAGAPARPGLRANAIAAVPDGVLELPALERLDLRWNPLAEEPAVLGALRDRGGSCCDERA